MPRLTDTIPAWVRRYVGLRYDDLGAGCGGLGCWALVRKVYAEQFGVYLPALSQHYAGIDDGPGLVRAFDAERGPGGSGWARVAGGEIGDVGCFILRTPKGPVPHVGVMVAQNRMLHAMPGGAESVVERIDTPVWHRRLQEVLRLDLAPIRAIGGLRPFGGHRIDGTFPAGLSLAELVEALGVAPGPGIRLTLGGRPVPMEHWAHIRPRPGRLVTVSVCPAGGKDALRVVASLALVAAAAFAPQLILGGATAAAAAPAASAVISGAVALGGAFALSALAPPTKPRLSAGDDRSSPTISGARNDLRPHGVVPQVLGFHVLVPPLAASTWTENAGDDQYLRMLCAWYGKCEISDIKIGDTSIHEFEGVEIEVRQGFDDDEPCRLFPGIVDEEPLSILLEQFASWTVRTTGEGADEISVDLTYPQGVARIDEEGRRETHLVACDVEYAPAGTGAWRSVNGSGDAAGSPAEARQMDMLFRTPEVAFGGIAVHADRISWGGAFPDAKPAYLPATRYSWVAEGWFRDPDRSADDGPGTYEFGVDSSDAADLEIDGAVRASWYGSHGTAGGGSPDFTGHSGPVVLSPGWHHFRVRVEARSTAGAIAVGWIRPGSGVWETMPASVFRTLANNNGSPGLIARWYDTSGYLSTISVQEARTDQIRRTLAWAVPRGQYDVRIRRVTADSADPLVLDDVYWTALRAITNEDPIRLPGMAKIALRIKATDQLSGAIDQLNCMVRSIFPDWDAFEQAWIERPTNITASIYRGILQGPANPRPVADARLDLATLEAWHTQGWTFNAVLDFRGTVFERLSDVAAAGRARFGMRDGKFSVVRDLPTTTPVQLFTPRNSWGFRGRRAYPSLPHGLRVAFLNEDNGYQRDERIVLDDGYSIDYADGRGPLDAFDQPAPHLPPATEFETIELFGVTDPDFAWRHGRYHIAVARLRPEVMELSTDAEHLVCTPGDMVVVSHDVPLIGGGFGRVLRAGLDTAGNLRELELDDQVTMEAGGNYRIVVRLAGGEIFSAAVHTEEGITRTVTLVNPVGPTTPRPAAGDLYAFGPAGLATRELVVESVSIGTDLSARLSLLDHAAAVHDADTGAIPPYDPGITRPPTYQDGPETPVIERIASDDWVMVRLPDGSLRPRMVIYLRRPSGTRPPATRFQVRIRPVPPAPAEPSGPWTPHDGPLANNQVPVDNVVVGTTYQIRLRTATADGRVSPWVEDEHTIVGNVLPPPDVAAFDVRRLSDGTRRYSWTLGLVPPDIAGVLIRYGAEHLNQDWEALSPLHTGIMEPASPQELNIPPAGSYRFAIKMVDTAGNESVNALIIERTLGRARTPNSIATVDARVDGWPGTLSNCFISNPGPMLEAFDRAKWGTLAGTYGISRWEQWHRWNLDPEPAIAYEHPPIDLGDVASSAPAVSVVATGEYSVEFRSSEDGVTYTDWAPYAEIEGTSVVARFHHWRITVTATVARPVAMLHDFVMDAIAQPVDQVLDNVQTADLTGQYRLGVGDVRLPIDATRFMVIRTVNLQFNGTGAGWTYEVVDKDDSVGPRVRLYNPQLELADALIDATVSGF
jgi:hypothetical protein